MIGNCSYVTAYSAQRLRIYEKMYSSDPSLADLVYSFIFGVMANTIKYRACMVRIAFHEEMGDTAGVYGEGLRALWETLWFDNLFYEGHNASSLRVGYQGAGGLDYDQQQAVHARYLLGSDPRINVKVPGVKTFDLSQKYDIPSNYSYQIYSWGFGLLDRFADFFEPLSKMQQCNRLAQEIESKVIRILDNYPG